MGIPRTINIDLKTKKEVRINNLWEIMRREHSVSIILFSISGRKIKLTGKDQRDQDVLKTVIHEFLLLYMSKL